MRKLARFSLLCVALLPLHLLAQEADSGFELRTTLIAEAAGSSVLQDAPRDGAPVTGGFRAMLYPVWKINRHWSLEGAVQIHSRPYFFDEFSTQGYGVKTDILQGHLNYAQFWKKASIVVRAGMLSSAFGSFLLRYDDGVNPLIDKPLDYGYYSGISLLGLAGVQLDGTYGKWDFRGQFVNSNAVNPRSIFDHDQYGNWAGGAGYTIAQGFRVGGSFLRGPYLDRQDPYFFPGESPPNTLPATGVGIDVSWGRGPWNAYGEWQRFQYDYHVIPTFRQQFAYGELRRVLAPRWYLAARVGQMTDSVGPALHVFEGAVGYRPGAFELLKLGFETDSGYDTDKTVALQFVTTLRPLAFSRN